MKLELTSYKKGSYAQFICEKPFIRFEQKMGAAHNGGDANHCHISITPNVVGAQVEIKALPTIDEREVFELVCQLLEMTILRKEESLDHAKDVYAQFKKEPTP